MIEQHLAAEGTADGQFVLFRKSLEACDAFLGPARAADDEDRAFCLIKHFCEGGHLRRARMCLDGCVGLRLGRFDLFHQHVFGQRQHHRAGAAGGCDGKGAGDEFGNAAGVVDLAHPFGEFGEGAAIFHFLKGLALTRFALHLADEEDHRNGILPCDMQAGRGVGCARTTGHHADAWFAGQPAPGVGHHGGAAFLAADHGFDAAFIKRIQHGEIAFPGTQETRETPLAFSASTINCPPVLFIPAAVMASWSFRCFPVRPAPAPDVRRASGSGVHSAAAFAT